MQFIIIISGPVSLPTIYNSQRCTTDELCLSFFQHPAMMQEKERKKLEPVQRNLWEKTELKHKPVKTMI